MDFSFPIQNSPKKSVHLKFENIFVYILSNKFTQPFDTALQKSVPADTALADVSKAEKVINIKN